MNKNAGSIIVSSAHRSVRMGIKMKWEKQSKLFDKETWNIQWFKKNVMCPVPFFLNKNVLRVYVALCDNENRGRVGFIDVNPENPNEILGYSNSPVLDVGAPGCFDEDGVLPASVVEADGKIYLFYSAYQRQINVPYTSLSGIACSEDGGNHFYRMREVPILDRIDGEKFIRSSIEVVRNAECFDMYYASGDKWVVREGKTYPVYTIKHMKSNKLLDWPGNGEIVFDFFPGEYGMTDAQVIRDETGWKMFFSVRSWKKGYRLAYATSKDGRHWERQENERGITISAEGWDSEMICFGRTIEYNNKMYLFYCGNHYGMGGLGWASRSVEIQ